jgi:hypothetical protein
MQITGWTEASFTASSDEHTNLPMGFNLRANEFLLQQNWLRIDRAVVTSGTTEPTFGFRLDTILPGADYRFTLARGLFSGQLTADNGQPMRGARFGGKLLGSPWKFNQSGKSGLWISELFPELSKYADELCLLRGMHTDVPAHSQAFLQLHTGIFQFKRPSMGAWTFYGLGTDNENLPSRILSHISRSEPNRRPIQDARQSKWHRPSTQPTQDHRTHIT